MKLAVFLGIGMATGSVFKCASFNAAAVICKGFSGELRL